MQNLRAFFLDNRVQTLSRQLFCYVSMQTLPCNEQHLPTTFIIFWPLLVLHLPEPQQLRHREDWSNGNAPHFYSEGSRFESGPWYRLHWLRVSPQILQAYFGTVPQVRPRPLPSESFSVHQSSIRRYIVSILWASSSNLPPRRPGFDLRSGHVGFVVDKVALGQVSSEYFGFPCQFSFHRLPHTNQPSSGASTIGQMVADVPSGLSLTQPQETKKNQLPTQIKSSSM
jgi:hypothetical protein